MPSLASTVVDKPWLLSMPSWTTNAALLCLAAFSTALAYIIYFRLLATVGATNLLLVTLLLPATAISLDVLVLGESMMVHHGAGMALIAIGLAAIDGRLWKMFRGA
jgi:drug/metabolite transporter (DMT)-like permease